MAAPAKFQALLDSRAFAIAIFGITGLIFMPVLAWLARHTAAHEQLLHAFMVYLFTGFLLVMQGRIALRPEWDFSTRSQNLLLAGYATLLLAILIGIPVLTLLALIVCLAALLLWIFGQQQQRLVLSTTIAFGAFLVLAIYLPVLDWPLRSIAGKWSGYLLSLMGSDAELGLYRGSNEPMLILVHAGRPFHVAAECNGFGLLTSSLLMATIIVLYRTISWLDRGLLLISALFIGFVFNALRIVVIVLLAPRLPDEAYMIMHEAVGLTATYGGLAVLYFLLMPANNKSRANPAD